METVTATLDTSKSLPEKGPLQSYVLGDSISYGLRMAGLTSALHEKLGGKVKISHDAGRSITSPGTQIKKTVMQSIDIDHDHIAHSGVIIIVLGTNQLETSFAYGGLGNIHGAYPELSRAILQALPASMAAAPQRVSRRNDVVSIWTGQ